MGDNEWQTCTSPHQRFNGSRAPVHAQVEVAAQSIIVLAVRTVCIAQSCAHVIAMEILYSICDGDVVSNYDADGDDDDNDNDNDSE